MLFKSKNKGNDDRPDPPINELKSRIEGNQSDQNIPKSRHSDKDLKNYRKNEAPERKPDPPLTIPPYRDRFRKVYSSNRSDVTINSAPAKLHPQNDCISVKTEPPAIPAQRRSSNPQFRKFAPVSQPKQNLKQRPKPQQKLSDEMTCDLTLSSYERLKRPNTPTSVPEGDITIVYTDIQGSTAMWEANPVAMKEALDLHDRIIRKCYSNQNGYEITTEGDAFQLAFNHPLDAFKFALRCQIDLHKANWSPGILKLKTALDSENDSFRGFRVRMGIHHGATRSKVHSMTGRIFYEGETVSITKAIEKMCHGGQILTTIETWKMVGGMSERELGSPQVLDCGEHLLYQNKKKDKSATVSKQILQLVPRRFAYDYFSARGTASVDSNIKGNNKSKIIKGRQFPPLVTKGQLSASFHDAPFSNSKATIVFVYTVNRNDVDLSDRVRDKNSATLSKIVRNLLVRGDPPGYECQQDNGSWMLAFHKTVHAVSFSLNLLETVSSAPLQVKVGIHTGTFTSMGPHAVTGRADYFGPIVNRAARVASTADDSSSVLGLPVEIGEVIVPPDFGSSVNVKFIGQQKLKGVSVNMALFSCHKLK